MTKKRQIHFLLIYPHNTAPSQRFRFEQFFPLLERNQFICSTSCFYDEDTFKELYQANGKFILALRLVWCFLRRCVHMFKLGKYECILIQRGAAPFGPPIFEWLIRYIWRKPIIYDFDDAIWRQPEGYNSILKRFVKAHYKVALICKWAHTVVVGNSYLAAYAAQFNKRVALIPTVVDTEHWFTPVKDKKDCVKNAPMVIGWTGSHTTLPYLESLEPVLEELANINQFSLMVMANKQPGFKNMPYQFIPWSEDTEVAQLRKIDIGIMPLPDDEWTKGKCGFKAIQYMAVGKPAVASAVGVNAEIIDHGVNGFLCASHDDWLKALSYLLNHPEAAKSMGAAAREKMVQNYSLRKAGSEWVSVLQTV
ncbi:glycosyltransferase family 4 protein [Pseudocnuella soli]|uniref:glycosyltransferase family 4 protein n=1 Tax=Pseudocnuella soli TaxID=2502779 RepID=UPI00104BD142|nr:glycosyltransferase family 4 protein [Pseudocnuella soli]